MRKRRAGAGPVLSLESNLSVFPLAGRVRKGSAGTGRRADWARRSARLAHAALFMVIEKAGGAAERDQGAVQEVTGVELRTDRHG